jgi:SAM-dependent methyltransferase
LDQHTDLFHSEHRDDHLAAQRLGQRQLSRAFELDDRLWIAHLQHELGALDLDRLRRPTTALWRFADAASNWRSVGELELASMAESAMELAAGGLSGREKYGWLTVSARDRRAIDALGLVSTSRVVEVGCGEGRSTLALADRVARGAVLALDRDRAASERAGSLLAGLPVNIACHGVDVLRAEPPGTLADAALAAASVEFSGDLVATFRAIATFVKPGGVISG